MAKCFLLLFLTFSLGVGYKVQVIPSSGVILERLQDVSVTSSAWTFVLNFELEQFRKDSFDLRLLVNSLEDFYSPISSLYPRYKTELTKVKSAMALYLKEAQEVLNLLSEKKKRFPRGVLDSVGRASKWLFGTATDADISKLQDQINQLMKEGTNTKHIPDNQLTIITQMEKKIESSAQQLKDVLNFTTSIQYTISKQYSTLSQRIDKNYMYSLISSNFREVELTISEAKFQMINLKSAIYSSSSGKLSPALIEPEKLEEVYNSFKDLSRLPVTFPNFKTLQQYSITSVSNVATPSALIFFVTIPVFTPDSSFDAFLPHSYPLYDETFEMWLQLDLDPGVLLLSHDGLYYSVLPLEEYRRCIHDTKTICFDAQKIRSRHVPHCLLSIYMNSTDSCDYLTVVPKVKPYIYRIQDSVIFSTDVKTTLNANCPNMQFIPLPIEGHGIIRNISTCTVSTAYEKLFPSLVEKIGDLTKTPTLDIPQFNWSLPAVTDMSEVLAVDLNTTKEALHHLREEMPRKDERVKLSYLISAVTELHTSRHHQKVVGIVAGTLLGVITIIAIIIFIKAKWNNYRVVRSV